MTSARYDHSATTPTKQAAWLLAQRTVAGDRLQTAWLTNDFGVLRLFGWPNQYHQLQSFQPYQIEFTDQSLVAASRSGVNLWPSASNILFANYCNDCLRLLVAEGEPSDLAASYGELLVALQSQTWQSLWQPFERQLVEQALSMGVNDAITWRDQFFASLPVTLRPYIEKQRNILESMQ